MKSKKRTPLLFAKKINDLNKLTPKRLAKYEDSLEVLRLMRREKMTLTKASKQVQISPTTVKRNVGSVLQKKNRRIIPKKNDSLTRKVRMYENGREIWIQIKGNRKAAIIARYHGATGRLLSLRQVDAMENFEGKSIIDTKGKKHKFETSSKKLQEIAEKREEAEFFTVYTRR